MPIKLVGVYAQPADGKATESHITTMAGGAASRQGEGDGRGMEAPRSGDRRDCTISDEAETVGGAGDVGESRGGATGPRMTERSATRRRAGGRKKQGAFDQVLPQIRGTGRLRQHHHGN